MSDIKFDRRNYRKHDDKNKDLIKKSLVECGAGRSIVIDADNEIIAGNGIYEQAQNLNIPIKIIETAGDELVVVKRTDLKYDDEKRKKLAVLDNSTSDSSEFDFGLLAEDFKIDELGSFGIDFVSDTQQIDETVEDEIPHNVETRTKRGDIWQLGNHRLMCGDSTNITDVEKLMNGNKADMVFTDPPYGVSYTGGVIHGNKINKNHKRKMLKNDDIDIYTQFIPLLNMVIENGAIYIFYATINSFELFKALKENQIELNSIIIWNKINTGYADMNSNYKNKYEPCIYAKRKGHKLNFVGASNECTVWDIEKDRNNKLHPTQKPVAVPARAIKNSSLENNIVLDLFGGSGSTLIACEQTNRRCYTMEIDEHYCDVIIQRWENLTGQKARLINENN